MRTYIRILSVMLLGLMLFSCETPLDSDTKEATPSIDNSDYRMTAPTLENLTVPDNVLISADILPINDNRPFPNRPFEYEIALEDIRYRIVSPRRVNLFGDLLLRSSNTLFHQNESEKVQAIKLRFEGELIVKQQFPLNNGPLSRQYASIFLNIKNPQRPAGDDYERVLLKRQEKNAYIEVTEVRPNGSFSMVLTVERISQNVRPFKVQIKIDVN